MARTLALLMLSCVLATGAFAQEEFYGWTLSQSSADPFDNVGVLLGLPIYVYLWYYCSPNSQGMAAAEFAVEFSGGTGEIYSFELLAPWLNAGTATQLLLATECPPGPVLVARWHLQLDTAIEFCIVPDSYGINGSVDCSPYPSLHPNNTVGLTASKFLPPTCDDRVGGELCFAPVSVEATSWGRVKALYSGR